MSDGEESPIRAIAETVLSDETYLLRRLDCEQRRQEGRWQALRRDFRCLPPTGLSRWAIQGH